MVTVELNNFGELDLYAHYEYRGKLHQVPGSRFDYRRKCWTAPLSSLPYLESVMPGQIYYKTPRWALYGEEKPEERENYYYGRKPAPNLLYKPYNYQEKGISFMIDRVLKFGFALNADSMGLGKTIQSIGTLKWFVENQNVKKVLIICKKSIKTQWAEEIKKFTGWDKKIFITKDDKKKRDRIYAEAESSEEYILITNYHNFLNDSEEIKALGPDFCIVDEAHSVKSHSGKMNRNIAKVTCGRKTVLLTGTPIMASPEDIYGIVSLASDKIFGTFNDYERRYLVVQFGVYGREVIGAKNLDELHAKISSFMIRRTRDDVSLELPERTTSVIRTECDEVQKKMYEYVQARKTIIDTRKEEILNKYKSEDFVLGKVRDLVETINEQEKMFIATQQFISDDPNCFSVLNPEKGVNREMVDMLPEKYRMSAKTDAVLDLVEDIVTGNEKVIIFTHFSSAAKLLAKRIMEKFKNNKAYIPKLYTGAECDEVRDRNISSFRNDPNVHILIGTDAMSEGLNLQVAKFLINYEQADTNAQREQRIGRIERIGSEHSNIVVYDVVTEGLFDEVKLNKLEKDKLISNAVIGK